MKLENGTQVTVSAVTAEKTEQKREDGFPSSRVLIGSAGSTTFFIRVYHEETVHTESGELGTITVKKDWPVRLTRAKYANIPAIAGGCSLDISRATARNMGVSLDVLMGRIMKHEGYGRQFVFLDDNRMIAVNPDEPQVLTKYNHRILNRLSTQADLERETLLEAMENAVMGSDLAAAAPHPLDLKEFEG